ncbi:TonB-dependent receptor [Bryobacter aggregatus]|uniref:TonB-dependent receptor n=1 Tax=Bryobacter aggregatus TaxID=360054 RepID=UPI0004E143AA|nr:carboxypeptidase regulatory-like domain-containing protein [Bryobacter aggregatus]
MSRLWIAGSLLLLAASGVWAQNVNASLRGTVKDQTGSVIAGAKIIIKNLEKGTVRPVETGASGDYFALQLPPQSYSVEASANGFKTKVYESFVLQVGQEARLDFTLDIGASSEQMIVSEVGPVIQSEDGSNSGVIDEKKVKELPLNGRVFYDLARLVPNVFNPPQGATLAARGGFNVAGNPETSNNFLLDGTDNNDRTTGQPSVRPSIDGIREFRILSGTFNAEYGRQSGGQVLVTTKSGSNEIHGTVYEFFRNNNFDARNFFSPGDLAPFNRHNYGLSIGAPIRKNRTFVFGTFEGLRNKQVTVSQGTVPTELERRGDFSKSNGTVNLPGVVGNVIPQSQLSATSLKILQYYPLPNLAAAAGSLNYVNSTPSRTPQDQFSVRVDHAVSAKNNLSVSYQFFDYFVYTPSTIAGFSTLDKQRSHHAVITDTHIFSPNLINDFRIGYNRYSGLRNNEDNALGNLVAALGIPQGGDFGVQPTNGVNGGLPGISITGITGIGGGTPQWRGDNTINLVNSLTLVRNKHTYKFGGDYQYFYKHSYFDSSAKGSFSFNGQYSSNALADFLTGRLRSTSRAIGDPNQHPYTRSYNFYVQDDWKVLPRLTLNYGVRYELNSPQKERTDKTSQFDLNTGLLNSGRGGVYDVNRSTGLLNLVGTKDIGNTLYRMPKTNFAPRFGFAYRLTQDNKTVVRGGYGIFFDQVVVGNGLFPLFGLGAPYLSSFTTTNTASEVFATWDNPFPRGTAGGSVAPGGVNPDFPTTYMQQWSFGIQREVVNNLLLDVTYQGSKGTALPISYDINQAVPGAGNIQARRPYSQWSSVTWRDAVGRSSFHSLVTKLERRYAHGLTFLTSLVYSKSLDLQSTQSSGNTGDGGIRDTRNLNAEWAPSGFDAKFRYVGSYVYELPFGKGRAYLNSAPRWLDAVAGGWETTGIVTVQTGRPVTITTSKDISNTGSTNRPNVVGNPVLDNPTVRQWYNPAAFSDVLPTGTYAFGNAGRNIIRAPGIQTFDLGLFKAFRVTERLGLQFRAEAFNALNRANFAVPVTDLNSANRGQINSTAIPNRSIQFALKIVY